MLRLFFRNSMTYNDCDGQRHSCDRCCTREVFRPLNLAAYHRNYSWKRLFPLRHTQSQIRRVTQSMVAKPQLIGLSQKQILARSAEGSVLQLTERYLQALVFRTHGEKSRKRLQLSKSNVDRTSEQIRWVRTQPAESHSIVVAGRVHCALYGDHIASHR